MWLVWTYCCWLGLQEGPVSSLSNSLDTLVSLRKCSYTLRALKAVKKMVHMRALGCRRGSLCSCAAIKVRDGWSYVSQSGRQHARPARLCTEPGILSVINHTFPAVGRPDQTAARTLQTTFPLTPWCSSRAQLRWAGCSTRLFLLYDCLSYVFLAV